MPPLLFIHGASCSARVWHAGFLQRFSQRGWDCHAIDLPGHGPSHRMSAAALDRLGLQDYGDAIAEAVQRLPQPPVLIGHSMGGYLAQRHVLQGGAAAGMILLAAAPPQGMARELLQFVLRHPMLALRLDLSGGRGSRDARLQRVRGMLLTSSTPDSVVGVVADMLQPESSRALRELSLNTLPACRLALPVAIHAGSQDALISAAAARQMAHTYGVEAIIHTGMAHMLQWEPGWEAVAAGMLDFLAGAFGTAQSGAAQEQVGAA